MRRQFASIMLIMASSCRVLGYITRSSSISGARGTTTLHHLNNMNRGWISSSSSSLLSRNSQLHHQQRRNMVTATAAASGTTVDQNYGKDMDQTAMMESDMLIAVNSNDELVDASSIGGVSKKQAHLFGTEQPRGILHRAFSFFLFNSDNKMLLTKRASTKITFPGVWTNTCCSHPLRDMIPNEVDDPQMDGVYPNFPGIKYAAIRKLKHELGIDAKYIPHNDIQFITRFQYWAADTNTYGTTNNCPWGEHEVDYILFMKSNDDTDIPLEICDDEVDEYKYVTPTELKEMMDDPELLWSPWFRGIVDRGFWSWWDDLNNGTLDGKYTNKDVIFFDPPKQYYAEYNNESTHTRETGVLLH